MTFTPTPFVFSFKWITNNGDLIAITEYLSKTLIKKNRLYLLRLALSWRTVIQAVLAAECSIILWVMEVRQRSDTDEERRTSLPPSAYTLWRIEYFTILIYSE